MRIESFDKSAIIYENKKISYDELILKIGGISEYLEIETEDKVALFFENRPEWIYSLFGIWQNDGICVLIDYLSNRDEVKYILSDEGQEIVTEVGYVQLDLVDTSLISNQLTKL